MDTGADRLKGGCGCGSVRYALTGEPNKVTYCHCNSCRRATGAPVVVAVMIEGDRFRITRGDPRRFESSPGVIRSFCGDCGTPLSWAGIWHEQSLVFVHIGTLDDPELVRPDRHAFCEYRLSWFDTADDLPRFASTSPPGTD